ncbi:MAG: phosphoenolpyruvate--protein phosphotransferase [Myxococcales bacterium]|nr:phosphoenolpyruvate--protein phosphotransferase [Myxococcales bacterium]
MTGTGTQAAVTFRGVGASPGMVLGSAYTLDRARVSAPMRHLSGGPTEVQAEKARLKSAVALATEQLDRLHRRFDPRSDQALILETHLLMLKDPMFLGEALRLIEQEAINAEWVVCRLVARFKSAFTDMENDYFRERYADIEYIGERVLRNLLGYRDDLELDGDDIPSGSVVVARDLSPADVAVLLRKSGVEGIVTDMGAKTSHVAILARARGLPCVVGAANLSNAVHRGDLIALDGQQGSVTLHPSPEDIERFQEQRHRYLAFGQSLNALKELPACSEDGVRVQLMGNTEHIDHLSSLLDHGAEGIGLFRTELLFLDRQELPDEEEHFEIYRAAIEALDGRPATFRTLDLGSDKMPSASAALTEREPNPALGLRGLRYCLRHRDVFIPQLKALLRAACHGPMRILFPMISSIDELIVGKECIAEARAQLEAEGKPFCADIPVGAMIETPAAAWSADKLARACDFFSIGTNDLIQYVLAFDRQNHQVAHLYQPMHVAVVRALEFVVQSAHAAGIPVAVCGEMAGDPLYTFLLLGIGFDELSMVGAQIPLVKRLIRAARAQEARDFLDQVKGCDSVEQCELLVQEEMARRFGKWLDY